MITAPVAMQKKANSHNSTQLMQRIASKVSTQKEYVIILEAFQNVGPPPPFLEFWPFLTYYFVQVGDFKVL